MKGIKLLFRVRKAMPEEFKFRQPFTQRIYKQKLGEEVSRQSVSRNVNSLVESKYLKKKDNSIKRTSYKFTNKAYEDIKIYNNTLYSVMLGRVNLPLIFDKLGVSIIFEDKTIKILDDLGHFTEYSGMKGFISSDNVYEFIEHLNEKFPN